MPAIWPWRPGLRRINTDPSIELVAIGQCGGAPAIAVASVSPSSERGSYIAGRPLQTKSRQHMPETSATDLAKVATGHCGSNEWAIQTY